jgi:ABC-type multidrug transport system ATPase subunit
MHALETSGLTYRFGSEKVLDHVSLAVEPGSIYGFLGPNGAGKTTTLKLTLGLLRNQEGSIRIFGKPFEESRLQNLRRIGSLIESPSLYGHLTARENLRVWQHIYNCPTERISQALSLVGLGDTGSKKASQFSLGMKQRLSIAVALLHAPDMLILDEPTNGLDPNGIIEVRELLKRLSAQEGLTILISSHLLAEIEKLVSHVGIIHKGRMLFQGRFEELQQRQQQSSVTLLGVSQPDSAEALLRARGLTVQRENGHLVLPQLAPAEVESIVRELVGHQIGIHEVTTRRNDLESIFINLVSQ